MTSTSKISDTSSYTGTPLPDPTAMGTLAVGGWAGGLPSGGNQQETFEALPAMCRVQLSGLTKIGPSQFRATLSLSGTNTLQLTANTADCQQNPTSAVSPQSVTDSFFGYVSRNVHVATVNSTGLVTAVGRGEVEITVRCFRNPNASYTNAAPSGTESVDATIQVTVVA